MKGAQSLSFRLTALVSLAVAFTYFLVIPAAIILNEIFPVEAETVGTHKFGRLNSLGFSHAQDLVVEALRRDADGAAYIDVTPEFGAYLAENPKVRFAVFESATGPALRGSDPQLVATVDAMGDCRKDRMSFRIGDDTELHPESLLFTYKTRIGEVPIALYGYSFHWTDLLYYVRDQFNDAPWIYFAPMFVAIVTLSWLTVLRGLAPLTAAAQRIGSIDINALDRRIVCEGLPLEVRPFAQAVNDALARVEGGVAMQRRFSANAAHELRTPLAILRARLEGAEEPTFKNDLKRDAGRLAAIVEQLLASARLDQPGAALTVDVDLAKTVWQVVADFSLLLPARERRLEFEDHDQPIFVKGDRPAIESVIANLIDNALRMEPEGGAVAVRVSDDAIIEIVDHGAGVAPEDKEMIFEPFWRRNSRASGAGLGLAIAKELMARHGGRIWVEDTPGGGATFKLQFPKSGESVATPI